METIVAIHSRRSIRKFTDKLIPRNDIERIISAGMQAPSAKNRQPWRFVLVENDAKPDMIKAMKDGIEHEFRNPKLPGSARFVESAKHTIAVMEQAPVTVFILNPLAKMRDYNSDWESHIYEIADIQSVGACIQNMLLAAEDLGYGSLWICDIFFAYDKIAEWLDTDDQMIAAVSFGVPAESPAARPRKDIGDILEWKKPENSL